MLHIGLNLRTLHLVNRPRTFSSLVERARSQLRSSSSSENELPVASIPRHGPGDACITLNVGGTEFHTLRSTVFSNRVLADHVTRAETNKEITKNGAVFIDRDPGT